MEPSVVDLIRHIVSNFCATCSCAASGDCIDPGGVLGGFVFLLQLPTFLSSPKAMLDLVEMGYVCAWLMLVTTLTRTISVATLVAFWLVGVYAVFTATLVVGQLIIPLTGNTIAFST